MAENRFLSRFKNAWNAFRSNKDPTSSMSFSSETGSYYRPDRRRFSRGNERSMVTAIYNRIAMDASAIDIRHVKVDENGRYIEDVNDELNNCLTLEANMDQTSRSFVQDIVMSMIDEGCIAIIPTLTDVNPATKEVVKIYTMRTGSIRQWYPDRIVVNAYNEEIGKRQEITMLKSSVCIVENPLYAVMNEPNSTLKRLIRKLSLLDVIDEHNGSAKLDLIIQLPYVIKSDARRKQADKRRQDIIDQLSNSEYGIAYTDGTEHITQLNRSVENNLMSQIEYLTNLLYSQLGISQSVMDGTADEAVMQNYYNRTIEPIVSAITDEMRRKFLSKTARTQGHSIEFFRDPFRLVPVTEIAKIADTFTRNEIMTSNEIRQIIGMKPVDDPRADQLRNANLSMSKQEAEQMTNVSTSESEEPNE